MVAWPRFWGRVAIGDILAIRDGENGSVSPYRPAEAAHVGISISRQVSILVLNMCVLLWMMMRLTTMLTTVPSPVLCAMAPVHVAATIGDLRPANPCSTERMQHMDVSPLQSIADLSSRQLEATLPDSPGFTGHDSMRGGTPPNLPPSQPMCAMEQHGRTGLHVDVVLMLKGL